MTSSQKTGCLYDDALYIQSPLLHDQKDCCSISAAFNAPIYHIRETTSTMDIAQRYAAAGLPHGTFVYADTQTAGKGRLPGRQWLAAAGENLLGTLLLKQQFKEGFSLQIGLAVSMMLDRYLPPDRQTSIKWPNDVLVDSKKIAGILCSMSGDYLLVGIGINILQVDFPPPLDTKAVSLAAAAGKEACPNTGILIEDLLSCIRAALSNPLWYKQVNKKLWKKKSVVQFMCGTSSQTIIKGSIRGISSTGALILHTGGKDSQYYSGEILL